MRDVGALVKRVRPGAQVSAAVFGKYPLCRESVGQDWVLWLRKNYVDFVCPMNYAADTRDFASLTRRQFALYPSRRRIIPGLGVTAAESRLGAVEVIDQIAELRRIRAPGFMLFDLNRVLTEEILPVLRLGITADP
jgi:uncharacterized lipoprotein YddW (UPF0748 family)